ncbi:hypothetical protein [Sphingopyxis sp. FD7]|uniref:hypothetical protein n=1 Tax=Sphingopyxis sp. FD7 TaxID=1914525 RepID=UPI000DC63A32|nr:hypothetical protein [Sphingopyxis sp. FD7]BBB13414.1 putrescine transport system permease protein PotI [Sphingopyxis sp. FD7]
MNGGIPYELLAARTPAEAKRHWMIDRMWIGSIVAALMLIALVVLLWRGGWSVSTERMRLNIIAMIALMTVAYQFVVVLAFSLGGPVGRWRARWGERSLEAIGARAAREAYDGGGAV